MLPEIFTNCMFPFSNQTGVIDNEDLIFSQSTKIVTMRWSLLFWALDLDIKDRFISIPETYHITVLALTFLVAVSDWIWFINYPWSEYILGSQF